MRIQIGGPHAAAATTDAGLDETALLTALSARLRGLSFGAEVEALCLVPVFGDAAPALGLHGPRGVSRKHATAYVSVRLERDAWTGASGAARLDLLTDAAHAAVAASGLTEEV
jgi:hypothetical protein